MTTPTITVYGTQWCGDCHRTKRFLEQNHIVFNWIDIDHDRAAEQYVMSVNRGNRSVPTLVFEDGSILTEPPTRVLAAKLGVVILPR